MASNRHKIILSLCDYTANWPRPYTEAGYTVLCVDVKHAGGCDQNPRAIRADVRLFHKPDTPIHGILAAPPCTVFACSGNRWSRSDDDIRNGLSVVDACLRLVVACRPQWWALENPVGTLAKYIGPSMFTFQPWQFGDAYTKRTCLWGDFVPPLPLFTTKRLVKPTAGSKMHTGYGGKSERTKEIRSATPEGFARAFFEANP